MTTLEARKALDARLGKLSDKDQEFARSLLRRTAPTEKQLHWIKALIERVDNPEPKPEAVQVANVAGIVALLDRGASRLKWPKVRFLAAEQNLCLSIASERGQFPGSVNVTSAASGQTKDWFGRIHKDGRFVASGKNTPETTTAIVAALQAFAADPERIARDYGRLMGSCCFCSLPLTDPVSVAVGYGPICADHYGLEHRSTGLTTKSVRRLVAA